MRLILERSQAVQGQPVEVRFKQDDKVLGTVTLPYATWIKFNKLLQKGLEKQQLEGPEAQVDPLEVKVVGFVPTGQVAAPPAQTTIAYQGGVSEIARAEEDLDNEDTKAILAAEQELKTVEKLSRTLVSKGDSK